ncbi:oxygen-independent coproporphyrinogen-3 oxidase [Novosphingobium sp. SG751A]|uniref:radical SAM family heme chaperone HemW n=1 Tax=Novosphingobium sp. SG751A TaxID=2587000 RepID=UPI0015540DF2|nr:radical SAM family heme chaperone HemW [Novosphingobium sp. SG751A]NOW44311.1 oxygen-independent coproporphyrinogen-3 oxidase [Novosphingobium sp. SG751A]
MARALYIHWPFCLKKCPYCDFNSHVRDGVDHELWRRALLADLHREAELAGGEALESIFFGGGTPSLMPPALVAALLEEAQRLWGFAPDIEITLEANPSSVEAANFAALAAAGVNRVSLGVQALDDEALRFLGRLHGVDEALAALSVAQEHFSRVSFDLIYARPDQSAQAWEAELTRALALGTDHLSLYQLTIEEGTRFATLVREGAFTPLEDDPAADLFAQTRAITARAGLPAYEVSNHAKPGQESRHNLTYWRYRDYAGIGPGAHGRRGGFATTRHKKPENWLSAIDRQGDGIQEARALGIPEQGAEAVLMGLRLAEGLDVGALAARLGLAPGDLIEADKLALFIRQGLMWQDGARIGATEAGMLVLNSLIAQVTSDGLAG